MTARACDIVIATRNRPLAVEQCLMALANQTWTDLRVVIVDDFSETEIEGVIRALDLGDLEVDVIRLPQQSGPAAARNIGAAACHGHYVMFIDDDIVADPRMVHTHMDAVMNTRDDGRPIVSFGPFVQPADWHEPTPWNLWEARQAKKEADAMIRGDYEPTWRQFHTGNNCMPLAVFRTVGGFDERFKRSEDDELGVRLDAHGCVFQFEPSAIALHYSNRSLTAWLSIPPAYAYFDVMIDRLHPQVGYLTEKKRELRQGRHPLVQLARLTNLSGPTHRAAVKVSVSAARLFARVGAMNVSMALLSLAYDLLYTTALKQCEHNHHAMAERTAVPHVD